MDANSKKKTSRMVRDYSYSIVSLSKDGSEGSINNHRDRSRVIFLKILSAVFYATTSFLIIVINKVILTNYSFPSPLFLGIGQMVTTIVVLFLGKFLGVISFSGITSDLPAKIFPLPLLYLGNLMFGLSGTQKLSLPMFTVLRRFAILMTLILEYVILQVEQSRIVVLSVTGMIVGAIIAALDDLAFDLEGYAIVLSNDVCTAANGVYLKKKLDSRQLGKYGLMYYNSLLMIGPLVFWALMVGDWDRVRGFKDWSDVWFLTSFLSSCVMGFLLMFSTVLCTSYNSALATTIIGCLKNILVTYIGFYLSGDYIFSFTNFLGVNISMVASLVYSYVTFLQTNHKKDSNRGDKKNKINNNNGNQGEREPILASHSEESSNKVLNA